MKSFKKSGHVLFVTLCGVLLFISSLMTTSWDILDFCQNYVAAERYLNGEVIYEPLECWTIPSYAQEYNAHPPFSIFMYLPLTLLSMNQAASLWLYISVVLYFVTGIILLKSTRMYSLLTVLCFTLLSVFWRPFVVANSVHNMMQILFFLIVLSFYFYKEGKVVTSGFFLGIASLLKIYPGGILVVALIYKKYKFFTSAVLTIIVGIILSLLVFGVDEHIRYITHVFPNEKFYYPDPANMSVPGFITRLFSGYLPYSLAPVFPNQSLVKGAFIGEVVGIILFACICVFLYIKSNRTNRKFDAYTFFCVTPILIHLVFPLSWDWSGMLFLLPMAILFQHLREYPLISKRLGLLLALSMTGLIFPYWRLPFVVFKIPMDNYQLNTLVSGWYTFALVLFLSALIVYWNKMIAAKSTIN